MERPHGCHLRHGRFSEAGRIYLVTTVTAQRLRVFQDMTQARTLVQVLRSAASVGDAQTLAYVLMPDHLHWLMQLGERRSLSAVVGTIKSISARRIAGLRWQAGFHDHALRRDEDLRAVARYVILNPVRAGLVQRVGDYPHWDAVWLAQEKVP
ncbi:MAG: REP-associated tyrosine transposase [Pseudomonadota bacterium]